jgi:hypothetical protein
LVRARHRGQRGFARRHRRLRDRGEAGAPASAVFLWSVCDSLLRQESASISIGALGYGGQPRAGESARESASDSAPRLRIAVLRARDAPRSVLVVIASGRESIESFRVGIHGTRDAARGLGSAVRSERDALTSLPHRDQEGTRRGREAQGRGPYETERAQECRSQRSCGKRRAGWLRSRSS